MKIKMKKILLASLILCSVSAFAQKVKLEVGQTYTVTTMSDQNLQLMMGMEQKVTNKVVSKIVISGKEKDNYKGNVEVTKVQMNTEAMGQSMEYDSDKQDNNEMLEKMVGSLKNNKVEFLLDSKTGKASEVAAEKPAVDKPDIDGSQMNNMENMVGMGLLKIVFFVVPDGKKLNDSWTDSTAEEGNKTVTTYTLGVTEGGLIRVDFKSHSSIQGTIESMGQSITTQMEITENGNLLINQKTSMIKVKNSTIETVGKMEAMGQEIPVNGKGKATTTVE